MFERFTDRARQVVVLARQEATRLDHDSIGPGHVLLGLVREGHGVAVKALVALGIDLEALRERVEEAIGRGERPSSGRIPFDPQAKHILELSLREALQLGHNYIGTEHILLGLIREDDDVTAPILAEMGADTGSVRRQVVLLLHGYADEPSRRVVRAAGSGAVGSFRSPDAGGRLRREVVRARREVERLRGEVEQSRREVEGSRWEAEQSQGEVERLRAEVERLRGLLREHGVEPGDEAPDPQ
jgi:ATP-dependent Clp protease ATP-binding subunit ClpC